MNNKAGMTVRLSFHNLPIEISGNFLPLSIQKLHLNIAE